MSRRKLFAAASSLAVFGAVPLRSDARQQVSSLPAGTALVTSLRMPLFDIGDGDVAGLLNGQTTDWTDVGSPISLPVEPLALKDFVPQGMSPVDTYENWNDLAEALTARAGAVAIVPTNQVDFRGNVLSVSGYDPIRQETIDGELPIRIGAVGDIVPGRNVHNKMVQYNDFTHPFLRVAAQLSSYDLTFANLEGNLSPNIQPDSDPHTFSFVSSPAMIDGFKLAGIDAVSQANNHSAWNSAGWGDTAFLDTLDSLEAASMPYFGAGRSLAVAKAPWVSEVSGKRVAIIGIDGVTANELYRGDASTVEGSEAGAVDFAGATADSSGTNPYFLDAILADIQELSASYDIVIPYFHFGIEYVAVPPAWAVEGARAAIDAGATAVVTNHPHVIQGMEVYAGRPIVYSLGNFVFDQMFAVDVRQGIILELVLRGSKVVGLRCRGVEIEDFNQPRLMSAGEHASQMDRFWAATDRLAGSV